MSKTRRIGRKKADVARMQRVTETTIRPTGTSTAVSCDELTRVAKLLDELAEDSRYELRSVQASNTPAREQLTSEAIAYNRSAKRLRSLVLAAVKGR